MDNETLEQLRQPERVMRIKEEFVGRSGNSKASARLMDFLIEEEGTGCASCFV